jgi:rubredoxin
MQCDKIPFDSAEQARESLKTISGKSKRLGKNQKHSMTTYVCPICGNVHLTSKGKAKSQKKARYRHQKQDADMSKPVFKQAKQTIKNAKQKGVALVKSFCVSNQNK